MNATQMIERGADGFDLINARLLEGFADLCSSLGGAPEAVMAAPDSPGGVSDLALTYRGFVDLLAAAAQRLACPDFGMRLAVVQSGRDLHGPLGTIMRHSRTFGEALDFVIGHSHLHSAAARIARHTIPGRNGIVFSHEIIVGDFDSQGQAIEYVLLSGHLGALTLTGGKTRARQVLFRHRPIAAMSVYRRNFGCDVFFDQPVDGLVFAAEDMANPIIGQDPTAHAEAIAAVEARFARHEPPIQVATRGAVLRLMQVGLANNAQVAADLGMQARTLHRKLRAAGTSFQQIKDQVRCELVRYYLAQTDVGFLWLTGKLGFSEQAVFTRFCRHHFGMSPSELRGYFARIDA